MRWFIVIYLVGLLVGPGWNAKIEDKTVVKRHLITQAVKKLEEVSSRGSKKIGEAISSKINKDLQKFNEKASAAADVIQKSTDKITNLTFSDVEIKDLQNSFAVRMGLERNTDVDLQKLKSLLGDLIGTTKGVDFDKTYCGLCKLIVKKIQLFGLPITKVGEFICNLYFLISTLSVSDLCQQIIDLNLPSVEYVFKNSKILDPELACTILLQTNDCYYQKPALTWTTAVPTNPPIYPEVNRPNPPKKPLKILHLTDPHITVDYEKGAVTDCGYPVCCKKGLGNPLKRGKAGFWGDYNCDIPPWLFGSTLLHINQTHKDLDMIYFTGDIIDHTIWNTTVKTNSELIYYTYKAIEQSFPKKSVFPVIGNHESSPLNVYAPAHPDIEAKGLSTNWLYKLLAKLWSPWLPTEAIETVKRQGYYAYSLNKKLKIIGLNNNLCYIFNWWLLFNTNYINEQLQFLSKELEESEKNGQFVHILGHVSVGNHECIEPWEASYNALVRRFAHIIKGQFVGHTHTDELKIFYDDNNKPINMAFNGASLTPYLKYNPNYKIVEVDPDTMDVVDIHTYIFNLTEANLHEDRSPAWYKLYSMKEAYGLQDLSPKSFDGLADKMFKNATLAHQYWRFYIRDGDASLKEGCDNECKKHILCKLITTQSLHPTKPECDDE